MRSRDEKNDKNYKSRREHREQRRGNLFGGGGGGGGGECGDWWMSDAADDYEAGLSERAETPSAAVFASMLTAIS